MPAMSPTQFKALADRISAEYELLLIVERQVTSQVPGGHYQAGASFPSRLLVDLTGTGTYVLLRARTSGPQGNGFSFTIVDPGTANSALASQSFATELAVVLQTDGQKNIVSTAEDVVQLMLTHSDFAAVEIIYPVMYVGGVVKPFPRLSFQGGVGGGTQAYPDFTILTLRQGAFGNQYTLNLNHQAGNNLPLHIHLNGPDLVVDLETDGAGADSTTASELATALASMLGSSGMFQYGTASNFRVLFGQSPNTVVSPVADAKFSGGGNGFLVPIVLAPPEGSYSGTADPDVSRLSAPAQALDAGVTAKILAQGITVLDNLVGAMGTHFTLVGYPGGMVGFMSDNGIMVHKNFSTIQQNRTGTAMLARLVFRPDVLVLATVAISGPALVFTSGKVLGTGSGNQSDTNFGPQKLTAELIPSGEGGVLAADWSFTLTLLGSDGQVKTTAPILFTAGSPAGTTVEIIAVEESDGKFYSVTGATLEDGGSAGDKVIINQVVERQISL